NGRGYQWVFPQAPHFGTSSRPSSAAAQNSALSGYTGGVGRGRSCAIRVIFLLPFHDEGGAGMPVAEQAARTVGERDVATGHLHLRVRLAAQLAHRLDHLGDAAAVHRMVVAQPAAVGVERQLPDARDEVAV